jgi:hypothetical protein
MTNQQLDLMRPENAGAVGDHWILYLIEGGLLVLLGVLAAFMPPWFGITLFGWLFLVGGIAGLITTFVMWHAPGFWWSLLSAVFTMGVGGFLFAQPELEIVTLFLVLITFLILEGIVTICLRWIIGASCQDGGIDACERDCRSNPGFCHPDRAASNIRLGNGRHRRHQSGIWRRGDDWHGDDGLAEQMRDD